MGPERLVRTLGREVFAVKAYLGWDTGAFSSTRRGT